MTLEVQTAVQEEKIASIDKKVDEIHKLLLGENNNGFLCEFNQFKGAVKFGAWIIGISLTVFGLTISAIVVII